MTTTDTTSVISHIATVIAAITPEANPTSPGFIRATAPNRPLRKWLPDAGGNLMIRRFDIESQDEAPLGIEDPAVKFVSKTLLVTICYPAVPKLYGLTELYDLDATIELDRHQIIDAIEAPGGLVGAGHQANLVDHRTLDKADERVWFQEIEIEARFYTARKR